ncbi:MAG: MFS transporter [Armatimonadota bacterium]
MSIEDRTDATECTAKKSGMSVQEIKRNIFFCLLLDAVAMSGWTDFQFSLQPLLVHLKASNTTIGIVTGSMFAALFGAIVSPWISRRFTYKKWYMIVASIPCTSVIGIMGLLLVNSHRLGLSSAYLLGIIAALVCLMYLMLGFSLLPHQEYLAACVPMSHRGKLAGYSTSVGAVAAIGAAAASGWILTAYQKPMSFGFVFLLIWLIIQSSFVFSLFAREKLIAEQEPPKPWSIAMLKSVLEEKAFCRMIVLGSFFDLLICPVYGYVNIYGFKALGMAASASAVFQIITQVVRISTALLIGLATDRFGAKRMVPIGVIFGIVALMPPLLLKNELSIYLSVGLSTLFMITMSTSFTKTIFGLPKPENRPGCFAVKYIEMYAGAGLGTFLMGCAIDRWSYRTVFIAVAVLMAVIYPFARFCVSILKDETDVSSQSVAHP